MSFSDFHITWTNPESGKSANSALVGPTISRSSGDRTPAVTIRKNHALFVAPGVVLFLADVGRLV
jgi:hypothetical protein